MTTEEARKIVLDEMALLERDLASSTHFMDKRNILQSLSAAREMLFYLELIDAGLNPRFKVIEAEMGFPNSEVFA